MGRSPRSKPVRLAEKLLQIRNTLGLSQNEMVDRLGLSGKMFRARISEYELGTHEPPSLILLKYARAANVYVDALIDDDVDLPTKLPSEKKSEGVNR